MNVSDHLRQVQEAAQSITSSVAELRQAIKTKQGQVQHARSGSRPRVEVLARFSAWVDETAALQKRKHVSSLVQFSFGTAEGHSGAGAPWGADTPVSWGFLTLFCPDLVKAKFAEWVGEEEYTPGPPQAERAAVIAKLEGELAELERAEEQLVDEAAGVGVKLEHRLEVTQRRERERSQRERAAAAAGSERRAADAAAEASDWPQPRATRSSYIHGGRG